MRTRLVHQGDSWNFVRDGVVIDGYTDDDGTFHAEHRPASWFDVERIQLFDGTSLVESYDDDI